jgi:hypothetical protein
MFSFYDYQFESRVFLIGGLGDELKSKNKGRIPKDPPFANKKG